MVKDTQKPLDILKFICNVCFAGSVEVVNKKANKKTKPKKKVGPKIAVSLEKQESILSHLEIMGKSYSILFAFGSFLYSVLDSLYMNPFAGAQHINYCLCF